MCGSEMMTRMIYDIVSRKGAVMADSLIDSISLELRKDLLAFERTGNPLFSTHYIDEQNNQVVNEFKQNGLLNGKDDVVKVIIQPVYLDGNDGFLDLSYYDAMAGCHLGLFPSYYEPWGYTPLESLAVGVPALTTNLSGFGSFVKKHSANTNGVYVLERFDKDEDVVVDTFANMLHSFLKYDQQKRMECKMSAKNFSALADWKVFVEYYVNAHNMALNNMMHRLNIQIK